MVLQNKTAVHVLICMHILALDYKWDMGLHGNVKSCIFLQLKKVEFKSNSFTTEIESMHNQN